jgi:hypothetical protein
VQSVEKLTDILKEYITYFFRFKEQAQHESSKEQVATLHSLPATCLLLAWLTLQH